MTRFALVLTLVAVGLLASFASLERTSQAISHPGWSSGPLLSCPDVTGGGAVTINGILRVASSFGQFGQPNYAYLYDVGNGDGVVNINDDILYVAGRFGDLCPDLIDRQVAVATSALLGRCSEAITVCPDLRDPSEAAAAGYLQDSQDVGQMGIHLDNPAYQAQYTRLDPGVCDPAAVTYDVDVCQLEHPVGLVYTDIDPGPADEPGVLIGAWYNVPVPDVCEFVGVPNPENCQDVWTPPIGFGLTGDDEDNIPFSPTNVTWHEHQGLCGANWGTTSAFVIDMYPGGDPTSATAADEALCLSGGIFPCVVGDCLFFYTYGWMMHLYNFIPNPEGRFMLWNSNVP